MIASTALAPVTTVVDLEDPSDFETIEANNFIPATIVGVADIDMYHCCDKLGGLKNIFFIDCFNLPDHI